uniref:Putative secreted protein n=1 Tax=Anopheles marajoara TaxID=58244 RepID=A0A2M4C5M1_9DIPT
MLLLLLLLPLALRLSRRRWLLMKIEQGIKIKIMKITHRGHSFPLSFQPPFQQQIHAILGVWSFGTTDRHHTVLCSAAACSLLSCGRCAKIIRKKTVGSKRQHPPAQCYPTRQGNRLLQLHTHFAYQSGGVSVGFSNVPNLQVGKEVVLRSVAITVCIFAFMFCFPRITGSQAGRQARRGSGPIAKVAKRILTEPSPPLTAGGLSAKIPKGRRSSPRHRSNEESLGWNPRGSGGISCDIVFVCVCLSPHFILGGLDLLLPPPFAP